MPDEHEYDAELEQAVTNADPNAVLAAFDRQMARLRDALIERRAIRCARRRGITLAAARDHIAAIFEHPERYKTTRLIEAPDAKQQEPPQQ